MTEIAALLDLKIWLKRIVDHTANIGIVGLGYLGLPLTLLLSGAGLKVAGFDIYPAKVACRNRGESYIHPIESEHIQGAQASGFRATTRFSRVAEVDAVLICVPTPLHEDHTPDMSYIVSTIEALAPRDAINQAGHNRALLSSFI